MEILSVLAATYLIAGACVAFAVTIGVIIDYGRFNHRIGLVILCWPIIICAWPLILFDPPYIKKPYKSKT